MRNDKRYWRFVCITLVLLTISIIFIVYYNTVNQVSDTTTYIGNYEQMIRDAVAQ